MTPFGQDLSVMMLRSHLHSFGRGSIAGSCPTGGCMVHRAPFCGYIGRSPIAIRLRSGEPPTQRADWRTRARKSFRTE